MKFLFFLLLSFSGLSHGASNYIKLPASGVTVSSETDFTPTFTGFGTVSNVDCSYKRVDSDALISCYWTGGTTTATEARVSLPSGLTSSAGIATLQVVGNISYNYDIAGIPLILAEASKAYLVFGHISAGANGLTKVNASVYGNAKNFSFMARVPITGW